MSVVCPVGHSGSFTQYSIGIYDCHECRYGSFDGRFFNNGGQPVYCSGQEVPVGLKRMATERAALASTKAGE